MAEMYPYQAQVYSHLMARRNVIVQAPTGTGKTRAALYPYMENLSKFAEETYPASAPLPLTCRYAVPMRVLAAQFEREYHDYFDKLDRKRGMSLTRRHAGKLGIELPAIQTGETPDDPAFASPLTFCTIDQLLASFIGTPYSLSRRQANLNVGAVVGSYLILDEFHLYPLDHGSGARTTALSMLKMLGKLCRFVLMTATFSSELLEQLGCELDAAIVRVSDAAELAAIMRGRRRTIQRSEDPMSPEAILAAHEAACARSAGASLVICNTVARAQAIFQRLSEALNRRRGGQTRLMLIHSRFTPEDRRSKSDSLETWLGEDSWQTGYFSDPDTIVVGTQVVEVGLNISTGVLHTELAPANSIIQRAGRCARFEQQFGEVIVYPIPTREDGDSSRVSYRPYEDETCARTWAWLGEQIAANDGAPLAFDFPAEQAMIDAVHTDEDQRMLAEFAAREGQIERTILETLTTHEVGKTSELIRNVSSASIIVHAAPENAITVKPFTWETFALHPGTLRGAWKALQDQAAARDAPWVMKQLVPVGDKEEGTEADNSRETHYTWDVVTRPEQIGLALRLAIHPALATYDDQLGFRLLIKEDGKSGGWQSKQVDQRKPYRAVFGGRQGSYVEHIRGLMGAYDWSVRREVAWVAARIEEACDLPSEALDYAIRLAIACHDIGKLGKAWQTWAHQWQQLLVKKHGLGYAIQAGREFLAKTDRLPNWWEERDLQRDLVAKRPPHACAGVVAGQTLIGQRLSALFGQNAPLLKQMEGGKALLRATLSAIARHHAPTATTYDTIQWDAGAAEVIAEALRVCRQSDDLAGLDLSTRASGEVAEEWLTVPSRDGARAAWLGFVLVRALRLCDQRAEREW